MRKLSLLLLAAALSSLATAQRVVDPESFIRVDQFGYVPNANKVAVVARAVEGYNADLGLELNVGVPVHLVSAADDESVFSAYAKTWNGGAQDDLSGDYGWWFDFSEVSEPGEYRVRVTLNDGSVVESYPFRIAGDVYDDALRAAVNMFYYQRVNQDKTAEYAAGGPWVDTNWYWRDYQEIAVKRLDDPETTRDLREGWFDAGDPNKYVTFSTSAVHALLATYDQYPEFWAEFDLNIPESDNDIPDLLDEVQYEVRWLKRMQDYGDEGATGGFYQKMGILEDGRYISPPSTDERERYYNGICANSTITGAGQLAHAAVSYTDIEALADERAELIERAEAAWGYYQAYDDKSERCDDGRIEAGDADGPGDQYSTEHVAEAVVAAVYLYAATGNTTYSDFVEANYRQLRPYIADPREWGVYRSHQGEAAHYYGFVAAPEGSAAAVDIRARKASDEKAGGSGALLEEADNLYRADLIYFNWGSNSLLGAQAANVMANVHYGVRPELHTAHTERAGALLNYVHGTNPVGLCYLSNMYDYGAELCADEMWHSWFASGTRFDNREGDNVGPAPGFLAGGANPQGNAAMPIKLGLETFDARAGDQPAQKAFSNNNDPNASYGPWAYNEPAIYYNANYVRALAHFAAGAAAGIDTVERGATGACFEAEDLGPEGTAFDGASSGLAASVADRTDGSFAVPPVGGTGSRQFVVRAAAPLEAGGTFAGISASLNGNAVRFIADTTTRSTPAEGAPAFTDYVIDTLVTAADTTTLTFVSDGSGSITVDLICVREPRAVPQPDEPDTGGERVCDEAESDFSVVADVGENASVEFDGNSPGSTGDGSVKLFDAGDAAAVPFEAPAEGAYELRVRVRTGEASADDDRNLVGMYTFTLDGEELTGTLDESTLSGLEGDTYWGEVVLNTPVLAAGDYELAVAAMRDWLKLDRLCAQRVEGSSLDEAPADLGLRAFPNPNAGTFTLSVASLDDVRDTRVEINDMLGRRLYSAPLTGERMVVRLPAEASGYVVVRLVNRTASWSTTRRVLVR